MLKKIKFSENSKALIYKLANDIALVLIIFFLFALLAETVLPGMVSGRRGFEIIIPLLVLDIILIAYLAKNLGLNLGKEKNKKAIYTLLFFGMLIVLSSLIKFTWWLMLPIILISGIVFYFLYQLFAEESK